ncbi:hypothetical protein V9T40_007745 [Parthenolecanium corni]|uniref:CHK kinase-like domain-containing protein n=1 Tax=Parthenolecanium corni TaxID=536013 RepID=A0AAN9TI74_9HEMI
MDTFISDLAETYVTKLQKKGEGNLQFVEFKMDANQENNIGMHSDGVSGKIIYKINDDLCESEMVFVKFVSTEDPAHTYRPSVVAMFETEIHFYTQVVPFLNSLRSIQHLIPTFLHNKKRTQQGDTIAILFRHVGPQWVGNNFKSFLDYAHLSLMVRKIGEFHAYSFAAKSKDESQFQKLLSFRNDSVTTAIELFEVHMKRTLERCLQPLRQNRQYVEAVPRLEKLVQNFKEYVCQSFTCSPEDQYYVLGHRSFNQSNVLFSYVDHRPVDMKIMDWQSAEFVSLGIDLICLLYADASQQTRNECWDQLLDDYYGSLKTTFDDNVVPSKDQIPKEMKKAVGAAILLVTYRANKSHLKTDSQDASETLWTDEWVTEILKDMVDRSLL